MPYRIAEIDVHKKKMLAIAIADVEVEGEWRFKRRQFGTSPTPAGADGRVVLPSGTSRKLSWNRRRVLASGVRRGAGARRPCQPPAPCIWRRPNRTTGTRPDERFAGRGTAGETVGRARAHARFRAGCSAALVADGHASQYQLTCNRVQPRNRLECLLEEAHIQVSSLVSDLRAQCPPHAARGDKRRSEPGYRGGARQCAAPCDARSIARCTRCLHRSPSYLSTAAGDNSR